MTATCSLQQAAMTKSYANQAGGLTIPSDQLDGIVKILIGFQPLGINVRPHPSGGDQITIAAYFEPALCEPVVTRNSSGLHFTFGKTSWIRGCMLDGASVRLFPDFGAGGANRAQTSDFGPDGTRWYTRNGERSYYTLTPADTPEKRAQLQSRTPIALPGDITYLHASRRDENHLTTIESNARLEAWSIGRYRQEGSAFFAEGERTTVPEYTYGIGRRLEDATPWLVTDFRNPSTKGIYRGSISPECLAVPEVWGTGLAFLSDGAALVSQYGQSAPGPFNGEPGALLYVPSHLFEK